MRLSDQFFAFYAKRLVRTASYFFLSIDNKQNNVQYTYNIYIISNISILYEFKCGFCFIGGMNDEMEIFIGRA